MNSTESTVQACGAFLRALSYGASVVKACEASGLSRTHAYKLKDEDADFAAGWENAQQEWTERSVDLLIDHAVNGGVEVKEIEVDGVVTRVERTRRPNDRLVLALVKRYNPEFQDDRTLHIDHSGQMQAHILHELSQPAHVLETLAIRLQYDPAFTHLAPALLPLVRQALAALQAGGTEAPEVATAIEGIRIATASRSAELG